MFKKSLLAVAVLAVSSTSILAAVPSSISAGTKFTKDSIPNRPHRADFKTEAGFAVAALIHGAPRQCRWGVSSSTGIETQEKANKFTIGGRLIKSSRGDWYKTSYHPVFAGNTLNTYVNGVTGRIGCGRNHLTRIGADWTSGGKWNTSFDVYEGIGNPRSIAQKSTAGDDMLSRAIAATKAAEAAKAAKPSLADALKGKSFVLSCVSDSFGLEFLRVDVNGTKGVATIDSGQKFNVAVEDKGNIIKLKDNQAVMVVNISEGTLKANGNEVGSTFTCTRK